MYRTDKRPRTVDLGQRKGPAGRKSSKFHEFDGTYEGWTESHVQIERQKQMVLQIFKMPPKLPRHGLITRANERWAQYMGSIFWPWDKNGRTSVYDWKTICGEIAKLRAEVERRECKIKEQEQERKNDKTQEPEEDLRNDPDYQKHMRDRRRYWLINSLTKNLKFSKAKAKMQNEYRHEF